MPERGELRSALFVASLCRPKRAVKRNVEPAPGSLVTPIVPPIISQKLLGDGEAEPGAAVSAGRRAVRLGKGVEYVIAAFRPGCRSRYR